MLFNSFVFIGLVLITFLFYYQKWLLRYQLQILIISSLVFYAYNNTPLLLLFLASGTINVVSSYYVSYNTRNKRLIAIAGVVLNLVILAFFKYASLIAGALFSSNVTVSQFLITIPLPIGISFYTFEGISLLVDVYKERDKEVKNLVRPSLPEHFYRTLFFISFFPHLVAGPILKAHDFFPQIQPKFFRVIEWESCFKNLILGYFLKMVVADNLKDHTLIVYPFFNTQSTVNLLVMLFGYSCQIFADFAGYSLIAIGLAQLFGYRLMDNFNFPYISGSFQEFWKRWHISLSSFLMEYLYIPLGGNRKGKLRTYLNLMLTMFIGGLWHGAAWSYAIWGLFHGGALALERLIKGQRKTQPQGVLLVLKRIMVFCFITFAWLLFKLPEFSHVIAYMKALGNNLSMQTDALLCYTIALYSSPVFIYHAFYLLKQRSAFNVSFQKLQYVFYALMLFFIVTNSGSSGSFIYFQF